jgi:hypothetical protein
MTTTLRAEKKDDLWIVTGSDDKREFKDIAGGIGYGDPSESGDYGLNAIAVVGLQTDDHLNAIAEFVGEFDDLITAAIDMKDRLLLGRYYLDMNYESNRLRLSNADGLTHYRKRQGSLSGRDFYVHNPSYWDHFRGRDVTASLLAVHDDILEEFDSNVLKLQSLIKRQVMLEHDSCVKIKHLNREDFKRGRSHPLLTAYVYAALMLAKQLEPRSKADKLPDLGYFRRL